MKSVFTQYVIQLDSEENPEIWPSAHECLRSLLAREIRRRGLWAHPPSFLGVIGWQDWNDRGEGRTDTPLDDLLSDCHEFIFVRRLRSLSAHARGSGNIDGIVVNAVRNFLHDTQKHHDPLGYRIFELLRQACRNLVHSGALIRLSGPKGIGNGTILSFGGSPAPASLRRLEDSLTAWSGSLLPGIITAPSGGQITLLEKRIYSLAEEEVAAFNFRHLAEALKNGVRAQWANVLAQEQGETAIQGGDDEARTIVHLVPPEHGLEERDSFEKMLAAVEVHLDELDLKPRTQDRLMTLWEFLRAYASDPGQGDQATVCDALPSRRKLAEILGIPRDQFPHLFSILADAIQDHAGG